MKKGGDQCVDSLLAGLENLPTVEWEPRNRRKVQVGHGGFANRVRGLALRALSKFRSPESILRQIRRFCPHLLQLDTADF